MEYEYLQGVDPVELDPDSASYSEDVIVFENVFFLYKKSEVYFKSEFKGVPDLEDQFSGVLVWVKCNVVEMQRVLEKISESRNEKILMSIDVKLAIIPSVNPFIEPGDSLQAIFKSGEFQYPELMKTIQG